MTISRVGVAEKEIPILYPTTTMKATVVSAVRSRTTSGARTPTTLRNATSWSTLISTSEIAISSAGSTTSTRLKKAFSATSPDGKKRKSSNSGRARISMIFASETCG